MESVLPGTGMFFSLLSCLVTLLYIFVVKNLAVTEINNDKFLLMGAQFFPQIHQHIKAEHFIYVKETRALLWDHENVIKSCVCVYCAYSVWENYVTLLKV